MKLFLVNKEMDQPMRDHLEKILCEKLGEPVDLIECKLLHLCDFVHGVPAAPRVVETDQWALSIK